MRAKGGDNYYSGTDRPLSAFVVGQFVSWQPGELGLVVLWRGGERWYAAGPQSSGGGGGSQGICHQSNQFGPIQVSLTFERTRRIADVNKVEVSISEGENVLLVDGADRQERPSVFRGSGKSCRFMQCDAPAHQTIPGPPGLSAKYVATIYVCEDLKAK